MDPTTRAGLVAGVTAIVLAVLFAFTGHPAIPSGGIFLATEMILTAAGAVLAYRIVAVDSLPGGV